LPEGQKTTGRSQLFLGTVSCLVKTGGFIGPQLPLKKRCQDAGGVRSPAFDISKHRRKHITRCEICDEAPPQYLILREEPGELVGVPNRMSLKRQFAVIGLD
jgi:hypothetical protein